MNITTLSTTPISSSTPLGIDELAHLCGAPRDWIVSIVEAGIIENPPQNDPGEWHFISADIARALEARRLERQFQTNLDAVAMLMDFSHEIRRLKSLLRAGSLDF